jgi:hypothetical protein
MAKQHSASSNAETIAVEEQDPLDVEIAQRYELGRACDELEAEVNLMGKRIIIEQHPNRRPVLQAAFGAPVKGAFGVRVANEATRLRMLREKLEKE